MNTMNHSKGRVTHFRNALHCVNHSHGTLKASCGIDALIEVYRYGVYPIDPEPADCGGCPLIKKLIHTCELLKKQEPVCEIREELWNWLISNVPSYCPKGNSNVEILQSFERFTDKNGKFCGVFEGKGTCPVCNALYPLHGQLDPVHFYDSSINAKFKDNMAGGIEYIIHREMGHKMKNHLCPSCSTALHVCPMESIKHRMPHFLVVSLPLNGKAKNFQKPQLIVKEEITVNNTLYKLRAAVQMTPGHFFTIVKVGNHYVVIDDLLSKVCYFPTFASAVMKDQRYQKFAKLSELHDGVHILVYGEEQVGDVHHKSAGHNEKRCVSDHLSSNQKGRSCPPAYHPLARMQPPTDYPSNGKYGERPPAHPPSNVKDRDRPPAHLASNGKDKDRPPAHPPSNVKDRDRPPAHPPSNGKDRDRPPAHPPSNMKDRDRPPAHPPSNVKDIDRPSAHPPSNGKDIDRPSNRKDREQPPAHPNAKDRERLPARPPSNVKDRDRLPAHLASNGKDRDRPPAHPPSNGKDRDRPPAHPPSNVKDRDRPPAQPPSNGKDIDRPSNRKDREQPPAHPNAKDRDRLPAHLASNGKDRDRPPAHPPSNGKDRDRPPAHPPSNVKDRDWPPAHPPSNGKDIDRPPAVPPANGKDRDRLPAHPVSNGKDRDRPPAHPPSNGKDRDRPPAHPPSNVKDRDRPPAHPPSNGKDRDRPLAHPPSNVKDRDWPPAHPPSNGKDIDRPPAVPPSNGKDRDRLPAHPVSNGKDRDRPPAHPPSNVKDREQPPAHLPPKRKNRRRPPAHPPLNGKDKEQIPAHLLSEGKDNEQIPARPPSEGKDNEQIPAHPLSEGNDNEQIPARPLSEGNGNEQIPAHPLSEGNDSEQIPAHRLSEGKDKEQIPALPLSEGNDKEQIPAHRNDRDFRSTRFPKKQSGQTLIHPGDGFRPECGVGRPMASSTPVKRPDMKRDVEEDTSFCNVSLNPNKRQRFAPFYESESTKHDLSVEDEDISVEDEGMSVEDEDMSVEDEDITAPIGITKQNMSEMDVGQNIGACRNPVQFKILQEEISSLNFMSIHGKEIAYTKYNGQIYFSFDILSTCGIRTCSGYRKIDEVLEQSPRRKLPDFLLRVRKSRKWILKQSLLILLRNYSKYLQASKNSVIRNITNLRFDQSASQEKRNESKCSNQRENARTDHPHNTMFLGNEYVYVFSREGEVFIDFHRVVDRIKARGHVKKNGWKYVDRCLKSHGIHVQSSFCSNLNTTNSKKTKRELISLRALEVILTHLKTGDALEKESCLKEIHLEVERLAAQAIDNCPKHVHKSDAKTQTNEGSVHSSKLCLTPGELIYISENFSGSRLMNALRKSLPGVFPSIRNEQTVKRNMKKNFNAVLLPRRTATGWAIDPDRLLDVLTFKYPFLTGKLHVKLWGDGREFGGRHSTALTLSIINDEMYLRNLSSQNPHAIYPIALFYESDSRDNLEMNLIGSRGNILQQLFNRRKRDLFYLSGDEMFLIKMLDASGQLSPTSERGWNLYHTCTKEQKKCIADSGQRTDLEVKVDRQHPDSIVSSIPTSKIIFDILHGFTRIVEKLLKLEVEKILSEGNKHEQVRTSNSGMTLISNLVNNINRRGIRSGNFDIRFDTTGKPEPITLNKDHALGIISPPPEGKGQEYPHVLFNVVSSAPISDEIQIVVAEFFSHMPISQFDIVEKIWHSLHEMYAILRTEPQPVLIKGKPEGSFIASDYTWGYGQATRDEYKQHAECFYKLFCCRYTWKNLTPYMIKFVDTARYFMDNLQLPICRFQSEGAEHLNYCHSSYFFNHTTRHGGKQRTDPQHTLLASMFRKLSYEISVSECEKDFADFVTRHVSACKIQSAYRGYYTRKMLQERDWKATPSNDADIRHNGNILNEIHSIQNFTCTFEETPTNLFTGLTFLFVGYVPTCAHSKKRWTQDSLQAKVESLGGQVCKGLPGCLKGRSTKVYHVLINKAILGTGKIPDNLRKAYQRRYVILQYEFVFECLRHNSMCSQTDFMVDLKKILDNVTQEQTLGAQHFNKVPRMISVIKKRKKKRPLSDHPRKILVEKNSAVLYANIKRREVIQGRNIPFHDQSKIIGSFCKEYRDLPSEQKDFYKDMWEKKKQMVASVEKKRRDLFTYNSSDESLYKKCTYLRL